jgi:predicted small lipoprotein YifL
MKKRLVALAALAVLAGCGSSGPAQHKATPSHTPAALTATQQSYTAGYQDGQNIPAVGSARSNCEVEWIEDYASPGLIESAWLSGCTAGVAAGG